MNSLPPLKDAELLLFLNELLEAERAGALVTEEIARLLEAQNGAALIHSIHQGETYWSNLLEKHIKALHQMPSDRIGGFYEKAKAIADIKERMAFLNRGQNWVARKLREALPRIDHAGLRDDLAKMLRAHEENFGRVQAFLEKQAPD